jgi:hypothetical protein
MQTKIFPTADINLNNNTYNWSSYIGGPFDPNGKWAEAPDMLANGDIPFGTQEIIYKIGFQNVGNAPAINVTTLDTIDNNFDLNTIKMLQSSFPVDMQVDKVSRLVGFHFKNINLPDATTNEPGSHGFVKYSIKLKPGVAVNTVLKNRAHNYFDFNMPVATNQTSNKLVKVVSIIEEKGSANYLSAIPNPFSSALKIVSEKGLRSVKVFNLMGALLMDVESSSNEVDLDLTSLTPAIYLIRTTAADGSKSTIKVIKE